MNNNIVVLVTPGFVLDALFHNWFEYFVKKYDIETISNDDGINLNRFKMMGIKNNIIKIDRKPNLFNDIVSLFQLYNILRYKDKNTIYYTSTLKISFLLSVISLFKKIDYIYLVRGIPYEKASGIAVHLYKIVEKFIVRRSVKTGVISNYLNNYLHMELGVAREKIYKVAQGSSNGISLKSIVVKEKEYDFCFAGRICEEKGILELLEAFQEIHACFGAKMLVIGRFDGKITEDDLLVDGVDYIPWQPNVTDFIARSRCFIYPSKREGFGNAPLDAASVGVPSIITNIHGLNETVIDGVTGIICKEDCSDLAVYMKEVIQCPEKFKALGSNALSHVRSNYNQEQFFDFYDQLFQEIIQK